MFLTFGEVAVCRRHPVALAVHSPLITRGSRALGVPPKRATCVLLLWRATWAVLSAWFVPSPVGCQAFPGADAAV